jgi:hypothetical protein
MEKKLAKIVLAILFVFVYHVPAATVVIDTIDIVPIQPISTDLITFNITGSAGTSSSYVEHDVLSQNGTSLQLDLYVKAGVITTPSNWTYSRQLQPLLPATYALELRAFDYWTGTLQDTHTVDFTVVPEPATLAFLAIGLPIFRILRRK